LAKNFNNENNCSECIKKLKEVDLFLSKSVQIGNALQFRSLLHEALAQTVQEKTGFIYSTVNSSFKQYRRNTFMADELVPTDLLAMDCGIAVGTADQALKKYLSKAIGSADAPLWDLLPFMYAASFSCPQWKDAIYRPVLGGHTNNSHTLARCISDLIIAFKSLTSSDKTTPDEKEIVNLLKAFVEVSSVILLRMGRSNVKQDKHPPADFPSMIVFIDLFIQECPLLGPDTLEQNIPYALLRNEWRSIFAQKTGKKEVTEE